MLTEEHSLCMGCMSVLDENGKCRCGYNEDAPTDESCIPVRTVVGGKYIVGRMIKIDGEAITYIGFDKENEEKVYIQEYMPGKIAKRSDLTGEVVPFSGYEAQYKTLMATKSDVAVYEAVKGMLPKNILAGALLDNLYVYAGSEHPHAAQQPKQIDLNLIK